MDNEKSKAGYIIGSLCATACAVIVIPKVIAALSNYVYSKQTTVIDADSDEDWGPVIEKKPTDR